MVKILKSVSNKVQICNGTLTRHALYLNGKVGEIFSPHFRCQNTTDLTYVANYSNVLTSPKYDLAVVTGCPLSKYVLDLAQFVEPRLGDEVLCFGYGETADLLRGYVSKVIPNDDNCIYNTPWNGTSTVCKGEFVIQARQHEGMSGWPVANSCGYTGMVHTLFTDHKTTGFASVIGAAAIRDFLSGVHHLLENATDCNVTIVKLPTAPFIDCSLL